MNFQFYLEKLFASQEFEDFKKEFPNAYFCSAFLSMNKEEGNKEKDKVHVDYFDSEFKKMFSFQLENGCERVPIDNISEGEFIKISDNVDFDFGEVEKMILEKMEEEKINKKIQKILLSLQSKDGKNFLLGTVFISGLGILKIQVDLEEKNIIEFEKKSFFDMLKVIKK